MLRIGRVTDTVFLNSCAGQTPAGALGRDDDGGGWGMLLRSRRADRPFGTSSSMEKSMHPVIAKTFGGLSVSYYIRHFIFGLTIPIFVLLMLNQGDRPIPMSMLFMFAVNTLLYPYSRFVYESVVGFIMGENVFFVNALLMLAVKAVTMMLCWVLAIFIAPLGLAYLYFHHSKVSN